MPGPLVNDECARFSMHSPSFHSPVERQRLMSLDSYNIDFSGVFFFNSARSYELLKCFSDLELVCMWTLKINYLAFISRCAIVDFSRVFIARKLFAAYISRTTVARINVIYCCTLYSDMRNRALHSVLKKQCFLCSPFFFKLQVFEYDMFDIFLMIQTLKNDYFS